MKSRLRQWVKFLTPVLIALAIPILLARCTPQWLPDSQGFVYLAGRTVKLHDLKAGKTKAIVTLPSQAMGMGLSPTGDRVAVVHLPPDADPKGLQISIYDLEGNEKHASPVHPFKHGGAKPDAIMLMVSTYVSPDGKHVVTFLPGEGEENFVAVTYDVANKKFRSFPRVISIGFIASTLATGENGKMSVMLDAAAATPDGKGIVAIGVDKADAANASFVFIPWGDGEPVKLALPEEQFKAIEEVGQAAKEAGVATQPAWDGGTLRMHVGGGTLSLHPGMRSASYEKTMRSDALMQHAEKHKVRVIAEMEDGALVQISKDDLQLWRRGAATIDLAKIGDEGGFLSVVPSPDRRRLLLRQFTKGKTILRVVDTKGQSLAEIEDAFGL